MLTTRLFSVVYWFVFFFVYCKLGDSHREVGSGASTAEAVAMDEAPSHAQPESRLAESEDPSAQLPSSSGQDEEAALEDVLIITADKEGLGDEVAPVEQEREADERRPDSRKNHGREKERDDAGKPRDRVRTCTVRHLSGQLLTANLQEHEKTQPLPHSRWEEDSEEEQEPSESGRGPLEPPALGNDFMKRPENAIFRRAISAIKPKTIEIKLRPERRVLLDSSAEKTSETDANEPVSTSPDPVVSLRLAAPLAKAAPPVADVKIDVEEKKRSVRDRLGDKVEPEQAGAKAPEKVDDTSKEKSKEKKDSKKDKDKRSSPGKDKVISRLAIICVFQPN